MAQLIDARDYAREIMEFTPPKLTVQSGPLANGITRLNGGVAFVPCLAAPAAPVTLANVYADALDIVGPGSGTILEMILATDMVLPDDAQKSRVTLAHEYGHFFFCTLLNDQRSIAFNRVWSQVLALRNLSADATSEVKALNEGFADWYASQVIGGTSYFVPRGSWGYAGHTVTDTLSSSVGAGMEENWGGPVCPASPWLNAFSTPPQLLAEATRPSVPPGCKVNATPDDTDGVVGTVATLLHDAVDWSKAREDDLCTGEFCPTPSSYRFGDGAAWTWNGTRFTPEPGSNGNYYSVQDELVYAPPSAITTAIRTFAENTGVSLRYDQVYKALAGQLISEGNSAEEVCNLFALHSNDYSCGDLYGYRPNGSPRRTLTGDAGFGGSIRGGSYGSTVAIGSNSEANGGHFAGLTAVPDAGFAFERWSCIDGYSYAYPGLVIPQLTRDLTCFAQFVSTNMPVVTAPPSAGGSVSLMAPAGTCASGACTVPMGTAVTLTATPSAGFVFAGWSNCATGMINPLALNNVRANATCVASFSPATLTVAGTTSPGGTVSPTSVAVSFGGSATLRATPIAGFRFQGWSGAPQCTGTNATLTVSPVTSNVTCKANFIATHAVTFSAQWSIFGATASATVNGVTCPASGCTVDSGGSVALTATPAFLLRVDRWECTESGTGTKVDSRNNADPARFTLTSIVRSWDCIAYMR